jgi:hypothetical protein
VEYSPLFADSCDGGAVPVSGNPPTEAQQNYQRAQAKMNRDPSRALLLTKPTAATRHPREIFSDDSPEADLIREWATKTSTQ